MPRHDIDWFRTQIVVGALLWCQWGKDTITSAVRLSDLATSNMDRKEKAKLIKALGIFNLGRLDLFPPPPLPAKHSRYALIGRVAAEWAQLEHLLDLIIWNLLTRLDRETASCLTAGMSRPLLKL